MKNRIFAIMDHYGLTASEFADALGISKAVLSSIKTERTQPTLTMVERIHEKYPEVSVEWLISGQGEMTKEISKPQQPDLFGYSSVKSEESAPYGSKQTAARTAIPGERKEKAPAAAPAPQEKGAGAERRVRKIILLYDDGSFDEYVK